MSKIAELKDYEYAEPILKLIDKFVDKHWNIALSCAGEWLYQDDRGQVDAIELVTNILEVLSLLADADDE